MRRLPAALVVAVASEISGLDLRLCTRASAYTATRAAAASILRDMGYSYPAIASVLGWTDHGTAMSAIQRAGRPIIQQIRAQIVERMTSAQPEGTSVDAELSRLRAALEASETARASLELEVRALTRTIDRIAAERDAARRSDPKPVHARKVRHDAGKGRLTPKPGVKPSRQRFGSVEVERLPNGKVVTRRVA